MSQNIPAVTIPALRRERLALVCSTLLLALNLCLFGPFEILAANRGEFEVGFPEVLPYLLGFGLTLAVVVIVVGWMIPRRQRLGLTAALLALGVLSWLQGGFLRWGYGELDGTAINWAAFPWQGWLDAFLWVAVVSAAVFFRRRLVPHVPFIALAFILIQSGVLITRAAGDVNEGDGALDQTSSVPPEMCRLSSTRNVIHIIMDSFQSDVFLDLVAEDDLAGALDGFVVFPENMSTGGRTVLSVPASFSTDIYDGRELESEYYNRATSGSFLHLLDLHEYTIGLMPFLSMTNVPYTNYFNRPEIYAAPVATRRRQTASFLVDLSMFRQFPHFLKRVVYNDRNWRLASLVSDPPNHGSFHHKAFFADYIDKLQTGEDRPTYHFLHLIPPHSPFVTLPDGTYAGKTLPDTRENFKIEARYILRLFLEFLDRLRELGLYDSTIILLHGDHGARFPPQVEGRDTTERMAKLAALLLFKPAGAHGPLRVSGAQTSLADIPATLMDLLDIPNSYPGESLLELDPTKTRTRRAVDVTGRSTSEPKVHRLEVTGSLFDQAAWQEQDPRQVERKVHPYKWGKVLGFGVSGEGERYLTSGWSTTSPTIHWSTGKKAEMVFAVEPPDQDISLELEIFPYVVPGKVDRQRIRGAINGNPLPELVLTSSDPKVVGLVISRDMLTGGRLELSFEFPDAVVPRSIGEGGDFRQLAMGLYRLETSFISRK